uniref:Uncharacterized protein n=1 Tax=Eiseniibacteriota bacterium TaxID=2212470 RepID=A0A832I0H3_UNCEI
MRTYQEHEQERASIMAITTVQAAITFPEVVAIALEHADRNGQRQYLQDLAAASDEDVFIDDQPPARAWDEEADAKVRLADALLGGHA